MRLGEENRSVELSFKSVKISEFRAIIQRKAKDRHAMESCNDCLVCFVGSSGSNRITAKEAGFAVDQSNGSTLATTTNDRIAFPITDALAQFDFIRPIRNDAVRMNGVEVGTSVDLFFPRRRRCVFRSTPGSKWRWICL